MVIEMQKMNRQALGIFLRNNLQREALDYFGRSDNEWLESVTDAWLNDNSNSQWRYNEFELHSGKPLPKETKILDMACGCGTFVFYGLFKGFDVWGIDPEGWKLEFNRLKADVYGYPLDWKSRFILGVGEALPFPDSHFDIVTSYQTLEHVQNVYQCIAEMMRVLKPGGILFVKAPDYMSTFEGHYRLPWLPLMPRTLAEVYLRICRRPTKGLSTINYVTSRRIKRELFNCHGVDRIIDTKKLVFKHRLKHKWPLPPPLPIQDFLFTAWKVYKALLGLFRHEFSINFIVEKKSESS
jgi:ubiquinone/menaquinone biosynthesis C-methylase UbiE